MSIDENEWKLESEKLQKTIEELELQLEEKQHGEEKFRKEVISTNRQMWEEVEGAPNDMNDLDQLVQAKFYLDELDRQAKKYQSSGIQVRRLEKLLETAYFGRIDFLENGENHTEKIYIGIYTLIHKNTGEFLIYDWRSPISSMFYDYETGKAEYNCPAGIIKGEMSLKRQYRIFKQEIQLMFDCSLKIDDEILQDILSKSADNRMKTIITSIQREQNKIIRDDSHKLLMVQGSAGSGKTSIALHRIAYMLYKYRDTINPENIIIFSPNQIFNDYISNVLPELGEESMKQTTFMEYARQTLKTDLTLEDMSSQLEYLLSNYDDVEYEIRVKSIQFKTSPLFVQLLTDYLNYLENGGIIFEDVVFRDSLIISGSELEEFFHKDFIFFPIIRRLEKIRSRIFHLLDPYQRERVNEVLLEMAEKETIVNPTEAKARSILLVRVEMEEMKNKIENMTTLDPLKTYCRLFEDKELFTLLYKESDKEALFEGISTLTLTELNNGKLSFEDVAPVLFLKGALGSLPHTAGIKQLVVDEAQDYSLLQYMIFKQLFPYCGITLLGDLNQAINPYMGIGSYENITNIMNIESSVMLKLTKSYRSTREIAAFSKALLKENEEIDYMDREGEKPRIMQFNSNKAMAEAVENYVKMLRQKGFKSIAIICKTAKGCQDLYKLINDRKDMKFVSKDDEVFSRGTVIIPSYLAKGLEFDAVVAYNVNETDYNRENERKLLYTICTRALHCLSIVHVGKLSPFISHISCELFV